MSYESPESKGRDGGNEVAYLLSSMEAIVAKVRQIADSVPNVPSPAKNSISALDAARRIIALRRKRNRAFQVHSLDDIFGEPAWDMMLDLFIAERTGSRISVSSLCIGSNVAPTTALRHIRTMVERGVFMRTPDPSDNRRIWVSLSSWAIDEIEQILA